jgi:hypothetical protein
MGEGTRKKNETLNLNVQCNIKITTCHILMVCREDGNKILNLTVQSNVKITTSHILMECKRVLIKQVDVYKGE